MYQPKNLLVTGGAGFIGSNFINYIRKFFSTPIRIINLDKLDYCSNKEGFNWYYFMEILIIFIILDVQMNTVF